MIISGYRIGFAGTSDREKSQKYRTLAVTIGEELMKRGHRLVSGGCSGGLTQYCAEQAANWLISNEKIQERNFRIISLISQEKFPTINFGQILICHGLSRSARRPFMASIMDALITIEGGNGTKAEGDACLKVGTPVVPVWATGGASFELWQEIRKKFSIDPLYKDTIPMDHWQKLGEHDQQQKLGKLAVDIAIELAKQKLDVNMYRTRLDDTILNKVFIIMPFSTEFDKVYSTIKEAFHSKIFRIPNGLECIRADERRVGLIDTTILDSIREACFLIVDLTGNNGNVLYEYGFGLALGKRAILLNQCPKESIIDVANQIQIQYDLSNMEKLKTDLVKGINEVLTSL